MVNKFFLGIVLNLVKFIFSQCSQAHCALILRSVCQMAGRIFRQKVGPLVHKGICKTELFWCVGSRVFNFWWKETIGALFYRGSSITLAKVIWLTPVCCPETAEWSKRAELKRGGVCVTLGRSLNLSWLSVPCLQDAELDNTIYIFPLVLCFPFKWRNFFLPFRGSVF